MKLIEIIKELKNMEEEAFKSYLELIKNLRDPEDADLKRITLRLAVDKIFHRELMEAIERAYEKSVKLIRDNIEPYYPELEPIRESLLELDQGLALIPGVPALLLPLDLGKLGRRIPTEDILAEIIKSLPEPSIIPEEKREEIKGNLEKVTSIEEEMIDKYTKLHEKAFHPVIKDLTSSIIQNENQHKALLLKLKERIESE
ncbi:rubrerythrin family protein [Pyrococcus furiosus DSM 3638]|uniref:Rubrerythrin family protein n=3 Tax=Pyrococcus furiosus TaxID=2261 RepID=A0A5C0XP21_PYRFU|nr:MULTISPECIES: ferritin family protein [Pyrococcus]AAL81166.1 hypothetical protein PF1042 [Pyrococcus furiosus DSM 3638]AFN03838.1 hypothetical protein PFC_04445 [Pyrococcus furiosus COM1]MDK2868833.1 hypothetical protein [Pyrococcus sp.]QEK78703.1 rubrerythrin family protein [Pyrococcus furiosus DSM 3638]